MKLIARQVRLTGHAQKILKKWTHYAMQPTSISGVAIVATIWIVLGLVLSEEKTRVLHLAIERGGSLARIFEDTTARFLREIDQKLLFVRMAYEENPKHFNLTQLTDKASVLGTVVTNIAMIGPDGYLWARTGYSGPPINASDREHFRGQVDAKTDELFISNPITLRTTGQKRIQLSRRLRNSDGSFAGIVTASVNPSIAEQFYKALDFPKHSGILLRGVDGVIRSAYGFPAEVNSPSKRLAEEIKRSPHGYFWTNGRNDGVKRLVSYRVIAGYPLVAIVGVSEARVFADYERQRTIYGAAASFITFLVVVGVFLGLRSQNELRLALDASMKHSRERDAALSNMAQLAHYDALTGLANRILFKERVEESLRRISRLGTEFVVFMMDLDKFKTVNDTQGHHAGDALLKQVAGRIRGLIRAVDLPARLGGDEFALIVQHGEVALLQGAQTLAERLIEAIRAPYQIEGQEVFVGCSIGIALAPAHGATIDDLLRNADLALYKSKDAGRNCFHVYSPEFAADAHKRNALESDLRRAIWADEFELHYQPVVSAQTRQTVAVEALVRWRHPKLGFLGPGEFIDLAEETGLIVQLGEWILAKACTDAMQMPEDIKIAVNLSPAQFAKSNILDTVVMALVDSQLPPERLEIEITENLLLKDSNENIEMLHQIKSLGVSIALDDFGVGYSSLSYLTSFPFDKIKIDQSFVAKHDRLESWAVISSIQQLAQILNLRTCVEGIETEAQFEKVANHGVDVCQGYYFGAPMSLAEINFERTPNRGESQAA